MSGAHVFVHQSQFPDVIRRELVEGLRARRIPPKFHYESYRQAARWLDLHRAYSPACSDASCAEAYDTAFAAVTEMVQAPSVHLVGLGVGGGQKEARFVHLWRLAGRTLAYTPCDVSLGLLLGAGALVANNIGTIRTFPVLCDLIEAGDLHEVIDAQPVSACPRIVTLFGVIPNLDPVTLLPRVTSLLRQEDLLLLSANMVTGEYDQGLRKVLPQYDNELTREWLLTLLLDLGMEPDDGELRFTIQTDDAGLKRISAQFVLQRHRRLQVFRDCIHFEKGEAISVFNSFRHTPQTLKKTLLAHGIRILDQWINASGDEGVFLCRRGSIQT